MDPAIRRILHVDMDAFYASVEQRDRPDLRGRPVAVGGAPTRRGVVCAASYEARAYGVRSAMPMARALRLCPTLVVVAPDFAKYRAVSAQVFAIFRRARLARPDVPVLRRVSAQVFAIFRRATSLVEPLSLDEAYLDVTENHWGEPLGVAVARRLKQAIREEVGLTASAGVAPNKFLAKIASGWKKPDGLTVIAPHRVEAFLASLPVDALWGVGPVTARRLRALGIARLVDVRTVAEDRLRQAVGSQAEWLRDLAWGRDPRPVQPDRPRKSVGSEETFAHDLIDLDRIREETAELARHGCRWLGRHGQLARTVTLKVRYGDFTTVTRSHTAEAATADEGELVARALALLARTEAGRRPVRLVGVSLHNLAGAAEAVAGRAAAPRLPFPD